ncbi:MAG TPA: hypothetical protein GX693_01095 [Firmicutes bacterium]|nr:hypothetical protein [Bacillota bacterium]
MPLLSRVYKRPVVQGIHYYQPPPGQAEGNDGDSVCGVQGSSGGAENTLKETLPPAESKPKKEAGPSKEQIERWVRKGYQKGKAEAEARYKELLETASQKLSQVEQEAKSCLRQARQRAREILVASEANVVELSIAIAEKLVKNQLEAAPHTVAQIVRESINSLPEEEQVEVYVHPEDLPACLTELSQTEQAGRLQVKEFLPDERLSRGSCRVESESGTVEYLLDEELEKIRATLLEMASAGEPADSQEGEAAYGKH